MLLSNALLYYWEQQLVHQQAVRLHILHQAITFEMHNVIRDHYDACNKSCNLRSMFITQLYCLSLIRCLANVISRGKYKWDKIALFTSVLATKHSKKKSLHFKINIVWKGCWETCLFVSLKWYHITLFEILEVISLQQTELNEIC